MKNLKTATLFAAAASVFAAVCVIVGLDKPVIALTNAPLGNSWRHQIADAFEDAARWQRLMV